ncbi:hypothetical protein Q73_03840 [Bacillus coahuilensis m2-6]|uniref:UPF0344 protein Q75_04425 n=1 Tax=Bacillus coahuilensis p1.1.43 TaxID=1150625 RepID=A0A147KAM4_9BACI|nr:YisL family protein [Bacillus coahuilensis]KUP07751.1 hypothetical protein Q75_04425 [Bacillus coahuilensis p1.1.43]KUP09045.1 hypothetical protein Q73_03840 [Bacillus coahuilensis m2-6]
MSTSTHLHITTWVVGIILFIVAYAMYKQGNEKAAKITHMSLRLFYILIIISGLLLFINYAAINHMLYGIKALVGIWVIGVFEMILVRTKKGKSLKVFWVQFVIALLAVLYLGFSLDIGINWF